jgi:hypothetical protein
MRAHIGDLGYPHFTTSNIVGGMTRQNDIEALLVKAEQQFAHIVNDYNAALHAKEVAASLRVEIKNFCENLRSVLDYLAHGIREKYCPDANPKDRFYFPIFPDDKQFSARAAKWFPALKESAPVVWSVLEQCQPYQPRYAWLGHFNRINNENKHGALVAQNRNEVTMMKADIAGGASVSWNPGGVRFGSGVFIGGVPVNPSTQMPVSDPRLSITKTVWVDFRFEDIGVSAIGLLRDVLAGVKEIKAALVLLL